MKACYLLVCCLVLACNSKKQSTLQKVWFYKDNLTAAEEKENLSKYGGTMEYGLSAASFIDMRPEGNFTAYLSSFVYGKWELKDNILLLTDQNNKKLEFELKKLDRNALVCINKKNQKIFRFNGFDSEFEKAEDNPFSIVNNRWRIKAGKRETDAEITQRLKNHFRFWEKYFQWGLDAGIKYLDVRNTPSLLEMYGNGFKLQYYDYQPGDWKNLFYDTTDSWKAYEKIYYLMAQKNVKWPDTKNRFEGFVSAFQQMQGWLK